LRRRPYSASREGLDANAARLAEFVARVPGDSPPGQHANENQRHDDLHENHRHDE
jgi:hypothetical protein